MTQEEKAKAYDELLVKAKQIYNKENDVLIIHTIEGFFPKLKESDDEKIRGAIVDHLKDHNLTEWATWLEKQYEDTSNIEDEQVREYMELSKFSLANMLAERDKTNSEIIKAFEKLEKQGEPKPVDVRTIGYWNVQDIEQKPVDKVEPKFKVGDWVVRNGETLQISHIDEFLDGTFHYWFTVGTWLSSVKMEDAHIWTIQDAKDGDVLVDSYSKDSIIILHKGIYKKGSILAHCGWNGYNLSINTNELGYGGLDNTNYLPATKEQRDLLFQKIHEAGYEWDAEKKELKKIEQNPTEKPTKGKKPIEEPTKGNYYTWSEEDKKKINNILNVLIDYKELESEYYWLKSLYSQ